MRIPYSKLQFLALPTTDCQAFINYNEGRRSVYYLEQEEKWAFCITLSEIGKNNTSSRLRKKRKSAYYMNEKVIYSRLAKAPKQLPMDYSAQKPKQLDENLTLSMGAL